MSNFNDEMDLFGDLSGTMEFLNEQTSSNNDGLYRVDLSKAKDKKKGYRSVVRFLPNLTKEGKLGSSAIEKIAHFVNIKQGPKELTGYYDSAKNFPGEKCALTDCYYNMINSKNAILVERAKMLNYSRKYYSYVLILEDEQRPELVGKVMIFQYGKTIKDKISAENNGDITGVSCNVFDLTKGKDFVLLVRETGTGDDIYPDYKSSMFMPTSTPVTLFKDGKAKLAPVGADGKIDPRAQSMVKEMLLSRDHDLEEYSPKRLTEEQQSKVSEIIAYLTGKSTGGNFTKPEATSSDFNFDDDSSMNASVTEVEDEDDFFGDLD